MSENASETSQASNNVDVDSGASQSASTKDEPEKIVQKARTVDILWSLIAFRLLNALVLQTFFQPDEYFQSLEPAWRLAFGDESGAWITWEWKNYLRSAIHPAIFATIYRIADTFATWLQTSPRTHAEVILAAPKTLQAFIAALGDYYTWRLAHYVYGTSSVESWAALVLTVVSPWQWFCSVRTLSNCLETTLTIVALYNWPWHWSVAGDGEGHFQVDKDGLRIRDADTPQTGEVDEITRLRRSLLFAAIATILRPTNILIWLTLTWLTFFRNSKSQWLSQVPKTGHTALIQFSSFSLIPNRAECLTFMRESLFCGGIVLSLSSLIDRLFYGVWTFPPYNFLYFNVVQSLAVFYGNNDWHYYLSQGYPLLLITALPFTAISFYRVLNGSSLQKELSFTSRNILSFLSATCLIVPAALSVISHKEVRFIYPLLPAIHVLTAATLSSFFGISLSSSNTESKQTRTYQTSRRLLLVFLFGLNLLIGLYTTITHNSGIITLTHYLRHEYEDYYLDSSPAANMTVGMLMPCHSTPWRSHLQYPPTSTTPGIDAWALTCEPPLHLSSAEKATYLDEADIFYQNPLKWMKKTMSRETPQQKKPRTSTASHAQALRRLETDYTPEDRGISRSRASKEGRTEWPDYLTFFEKLEPTMKSILQGSGYSECARFFNSHWHDDSRRKGDVVVWCLDPTRAQLKRHFKPTAQRPSIFNSLFHKSQAEDPGPSQLRRTIKDALHDPRSRQKIFGDPAALIGGGASKVKSEKSIMSTTKSKQGSATGSQQKPLIATDKSFWKIRSSEKIETWWETTAASISSVFTGKKKTKAKRWWEGGIWT